MEPIVLDEQSFKAVATALRKLQAKGRDIETKVKVAKAAMAQAEVDVHHAICEMRTVLDPIAEKFCFDPEVPYDLDYQQRALVPVPRKAG
jgi:hypothetical protein